MVAATAARAQASPVVGGWSAEPEFAIPPAPLTIDEDGPTPFGLDLLRSRGGRMAVRFAAGGDDAIGVATPPIDDEDAGGGIVGSEAVGGVIAMPAPTIVLIPAPGAWAQDDLAQPPPALALDDEPGAWPQPMRRAPSVLPSALMPWAWGVHAPCPNPNAPLPAVHAPTFVVVDKTQTFVTLTSDPTRVRMTQIIQRRQGETGSALTGMLDNEDGTLASTIPVGSDVRLFGTRTDTGVVVINGAPVKITDWPTLAFQYDFAAGDVATACTMELVFKLTRSDGSVVDDPNLQHYALYLKIIP